MSAQVALKTNYWLTRLKANMTNVDWILLLRVNGIHLWNIIFLNLHMFFKIQELICTVYNKQYLYKHEDEVTKKDYKFHVYKVDVKKRFGFNEPSWRL